LITDFLKSNDVKNFSFGNNVLEDANIVTYSRALNSGAKSRNEDYIRFHYQSDEFEFDIEISGDNDQTSVDVHTFVVKDTRENIVIEFKPQLSMITISKLHKEIEIESADSSIELEILKLKEIIDSKDTKKSSKEYLELIDNYNALLEKQEFAKTSDYGESIVAEPIEKYGKIEEFTVRSYFMENMNLREILEESISENISKYLLATGGGDKLIENEVYEYGIDEVDNYIGFYQNKGLIGDFLNRLNYFVSKLNLKYLGASSVKQSALFAVRDKNNTLAQAIHEFKQLGVDKATGGAAYLFLKKWMGVNYFDIGDDLKIRMHAGEAYEVNIISNGAELALADKGMGSIQAMMLILRMACIIHTKTKKEKTNSLPFMSSEANKLMDLVKTSVIIEEPELNLHPAMQSKLADFFHEVYEKFDIHLIVETHSEYLIRKTQLIVKENEYEVKPNENPFTVFYFDTTEGQWKMNYREDGKFTNEFGSGFYDVASHQAMKLLSKAK